jgi:intracellular septation protein
MKLLFDFLPILLFFGSFKYAESHEAWATAFANQHLGSIVSGGTVGPAEAPVLLATLVVIIATLAQVVILAARGKKIDMMLWVSLGLVVVLGGATIWFHNPAFIKWKPTLLYWVMSASFAVAQWVFRKNLLRTLLGEQLQLPDFIWRRLNLAWIAFFAAMGVLNLWVAFTFSMSTWASFKAFGGTGLMVAFIVAQGFYLGPYIQDEPAAGDKQPESRK